MSEGGIRWETFESALESLGSIGSDRLELYCKSGRSRRFEGEPGGLVAIARAEKGWAVRAGDAGESFFAAGTGDVPPDGWKWPNPMRGALRLPRPRSIPAWAPASDVAAPLLGEAEASAWVTALQAAIRAEVGSECRLRVTLEEGVSEAVVGNHYGLRSRHRNRGVAMLLEIETPRGQREGGMTVLEATARTHAALSVPRLARRVADLVAIRTAPALSEEIRDRPLVASPAVATSLLAGLMPFLVGSEGWSELSRFAGSGGRLASARISIVDDGRSPGGVLNAPVDGEGSPTGRLDLVRAGNLRSPLLPWWATDEDRPGCMRRMGWRDVPSPGPSHLHVEPQPATAPGDLLEGDVAGYLLVPLAAGRFDLRADRFSLPVGGLRLRGGGAASAFSRGVLEGSVSGLWMGVEGVGRDLDFRSVGSAQLGAPSLRLRGPALRPTDDG